MISLNKLVRGYAKPRLTLHSKPLGQNGLTFLREATSGDTCLRRSDSLSKCVDMVDLDPPKLKRRIIQKKGLGPTMEREAK